MLCVMLQASVPSAKPSIHERSLYIYPLKIEYNQLADHFHYLDQVSQSILPFFQIPNFRSSWIEHWELNENDLHYLDRFHSIRMKYRNESVINESFATSLFAPDPELLDDPIADAFYIHNRLEDALGALASRLTRNELRFLRDFFTHFEPQVLAMTHLNNDHLQALLYSLNTHFETVGVQKHLTAMSKFYRTKGKEIKSVLLLSAPEKIIAGACYGKHLLLRIPTSLNLPNPADANTLLSSVLVHEATHFLSGCADKEQKKALGNTFLTTCETIEELPLMALEEPLVVASQMLFIQSNYPEIYDTASTWFSSPLAEKYLIPLKSYLEAGQSIDFEFIKNCGQIYSLHNKICKSS